MKGLRFKTFALYKIIKFEIYQISETVGNYEDRIVRVLINFAKRANAKGLNEDIFIDIQGNDLNDFKIIKITPIEFRP